ncbi:MAG: sugar ABC transporter substrate-binding protein [Planctomycetes bacterium]|nr:sugar ABC transporter substrate-binding protein [Planctomycetota bacterium]
MSPLPRPVLAALAAAALAAAWACTRDPASARLELMIWGDPDEVRTVLDYVGAFRRDHPEVEVELQHTPSMGYTQKLYTRLQGGDLPDVFYLRAEDFPDLERKGALLDLSVMAGADPGFQEDAYYARVLDAFRDGEGRLRGIAKDFATMVLYYNEDLFDRSGEPYPGDHWDWEGFRGAAERLTRGADGGRARAQTWGFVVETWTGEWLPWLWQNGGEVLSEDGRRWLLGDPEYVDRNAEALQFLADLMVGDRPVAPPPSVTADQGTSEAFQSGQVAMCTYGRWMSMQFRHVEDFDWDVAPLPRGRERSTTLFTVAYAVSARTGRPREAWELVRALTGEAGQRATGHAGHAIPSMRTVAESEAFLDPEALRGRPIHHRVNLDCVPYARAVPRSVRWASLETRLSRALEPVWTGDRKARDVLREVQAELQGVLDGGE